MIVTIASRKGGAGKSTIATNLCGMLVNDGHDVTLIDCDDQKSSAMWAAIRSGSDFKQVPAVAITGEGTGKQIQAHSKKYEHSIIDAPGKNSKELRSAMLVSDLVIVPVRPSQFDLWAVEEDLDLLGEINNLKVDAGLDNLNVIILFNGISTSPLVRDKEISQMKGLFESIKEKMVDCNAEVYEYYISNRGVFNKATRSGAIISEIAKKSPSDIKAIDEIQNLYSKLFKDGEK